MIKIMFILIFLMSFQYSFSQVNPREILQSMEASFDNEIKGENNTYVVDTISILCVVSNKVIYFENVNSKIGAGAFRVRMEDSNILKLIFKQYLSAHFKKYQLDDKDNLTVKLFAEMSGKIRDISFSYNVDWDIPIVVLEQIERKIKEQCRLTFDKNLPALAHANYVSLDFPVFIKDFCY